MPQPWSLQTPAGTITVNIWLTNAFRSKKSSCNETKKLVPVDAKNFARVQSHTNMKKWGGLFGLNRFHHMRKVSGPEDPLQKPNADTLYSIGVIDLSGGPGSDKK